MQISSLFICFHPFMPPLIPTNIKQKIMEFLNCGRQNKGFPAKDHNNKFKIKNYFSSLLNILFNLWSINSLKSWLGKWSHVALRCHFDNLFDSLLYRFDDYKLTCNQFWFLLGLRLRLRFLIFSKDLAKVKKITDYVPYWNESGQRIKMMQHYKELSR